MSQSDVLNHLFDSLGWEPFNTKVFYAKKEDDTGEHVLAGWFVESDILPEDHYLGANYLIALEYIVAYSEQYSMVATRMLDLKFTDPERYENTCMMLYVDDRDCLRYLFPEDEPQEVEVVYATSTELLLAFMAGIGVSLLGFVLCYWPEILNGIIG